MTKRQDILNDIEEAFGFVPGWLGDMPDGVLEQYWTNHVWVCNDTALSGRDKALIAFGAAAAIHCGYRTPFHTAQLGLFGLDDEQIKEAGWVVQNATGASAYLYGVGYDQETFREELDRLVEFRKKAHET
ncbi:MAG: carboxymuconolactone decarboxylase family protein [Anaerolineae bacterium]